MKYNEANVRQGYNKMRTEERSLIGPFNIVLIKKIMPREIKALEERANIFFQKAKNTAFPKTNL